MMAKAPIHKWIFRTRRGLVMAWCPGLDLQSTAGWSQVQWNDFATELAQARQRDEADPLARFRGSFIGPPDTIYMEGNSLGLCSTQAEDAVHRALHDWRRFAIGGWLSASPPWFSLADEISAMMAPL